MLTKKEISRIVNYFDGGRIGDVFASPNFSGTNGSLLRGKLMNLWRWCDWGKPLQIIVEDSGWRYTGEGTGLKSPQARELFNFLNTLIK